MMRIQSMTRRGFAALAGASALAPLFGHKAKASGAPLTREALVTALGSLGIRSGGSVQIGGSSYRLESVHVGQAGQVFLISFKADPE